MDYRIKHAASSAKKPRLKLRPWGRNAQLGVGIPLATFMAVESAADGPMWRKKDKKAQES